MRLIIDKSIKRVVPNCRLGYVIVNAVNVRGTPPALAREFSQLQAEAAKMYNIDILQTVPRIIAVRSMYKKLDFDPSRYRPASEALVRRVLNNKGLYFVNSAVDVNNYCSIKYLMPFGLYDADQIQGDITYRMAEKGFYVNISGKEVSTNGKPFLADQDGVFGNPTSDARRTAVTLSTKNIMSVVYADEEIADSTLSEVLDFAGAMLVRYNGGTIKAKEIAEAG
ncbi:hypothetical protein SDC9_127035 [bioreactor metagenome]|uniref:B3/B4 tRNA-binding domain-containing protein n=1 Tax=bioreactor metagenome TaxID=1076179 RepID=A0A645CTG3_9ZZZZ